MNKTATIKSFQEACIALNISSALPDFSSMSAKDKAAMEAHYQLMIIVQALNGGWTPNWTDSSEYKYYPWFDMYGGGFVLRGVLYGYSGTYAGSRLCFRSRELAKYAADTFIDLYKQYMVIE